MIRASLSYSVIITVPSSAEEMLQNTPVQRLKRGNLTTGPLSSRLVTCAREFSVTVKPNVKRAGRQT